MKKGNTIKLVLVLIAIVVVGFGSLKRKYGGFVFGKSIISIRSEIYCKAIAHNLSLEHQEIFN